MNAHELGEVRSEHRGRNLEGSIAVVVIAVAGGALALLLGDPWLVSLPVGAAALWFGLTSFWTPRRVLLREEGIEAHWHFRKPKLVSFRGCEIFRDLEIKTTIAGTFLTGCTLKLVDTDNRSVRLNPRFIVDAEHLFTRIERLVVYPKGRALNDDFDAGKAVAFGSVTVDQEGVTIAERLTPWEDLREVEVSPVLMIFRFRGRIRRVVRIKRISFPWVLTRIVAARGVPLKYFDGFKAA